MHDSHNLPRVMHSEVSWSGSRGLMHSDVSWPGSRGSIHSEVSWLHYPESSSSSPEIFYFQSPTDGVYYIWIATPVQLRPPSRPVVTSHPGCHKKLPLHHQRM